MVFDHYGHVHLVIVMNLCQSHTQPTAQAWPFATRDAEFSAGETWIPILISVVWLSRVSNAVPADPLADTQTHDKQFCVLYSTLAVTALPLHQPYSDFDRSKFATMEFAP